MKKVLVILMMILMVGVVFGECKEDPLSSLDDDVIQNFKIPEGCLDKYIEECSLVGANFNTFGKLDDNSQKKVINKLLEKSNTAKVGEILNGYKANKMDVEKAAELFGKIDDSENQKKVFSKIEDSALRTKILKNKNNWKNMFKVNKVEFVDNANFEVSGSGEMIIINGQKFDINFFEGMNVQIEKDDTIFLNNVGYFGESDWTKNNDGTVSLNGHKIQLPNKNNQNKYYLFLHNNEYLSVKRFLNDGRSSRTPFLSKDFELDLSDEKPIIVDEDKRFSSTIGDGFFSLEKQDGKYTISTLTNKKEKLTSTIDPQLFGFNLELNKGDVNNKEFMQINLDKKTLFNGQNMNLIKTDNGIKVSSKQSVQVVDSGFINFNILNINPGKECEFEFSYSYDGIIDKKLNIIDGKGGVKVISGEGDAIKYFEKNPNIDKEFYKGLEPIPPLTTQKSSGPAVKTFLLKTQTSAPPTSETLDIPETINPDKIWKQSLLENTVYSDSGIPEEYNLQDFGGDELELREAQDRFEETLQKVRDNPKDTASMGELQSQLQTMYNSASEDDKKKIRSIAQTLAKKDNQIELTEPLTVGQSIKSLCLWCKDKVDRTTITYPITEQKAAAEKSVEPLQQSDDTRIPKPAKITEENLKAVDVKELSNTKLVASKTVVGDGKVEIHGDKPVTVQTVEGGATLTSGNAKLTIVEEDSGEKTIDITIGNTATISHSGALVVTGITKEGETLAVGEDRIYLTNALKTDFYEYISPAEGLVYTTDGTNEGITNIHTVAIPKTAETKTMEMNGRTYTYQTVAMTRTDNKFKFSDESHSVFGQRFAVVNLGSDKFNGATMHYIPLDQVSRVVDDSDAAKQLKAADEAKIKAYLEGNNARGNAVEEYSTP